MDENTAQLGSSVQSEVEEMLLTSLITWCLPDMRSRIQLHRELIRPRAQSSTSRLEGEGEGIVSGKVVMISKLQLVKSVF